MSLVVWVWGGRRRIFGSRACSGIQWRRQLTCVDSIGERENERSPTRSVQPVAQPAATPTVAHDAPPQRSSYSPFSADHAAVTWFRAAADEHPSCVRDSSITGLRHRIGVVASKPAEIIASVDTAIAGRTRLSRQRGNLRRRRPVVGTFSVNPSPLRTQPRRRAVPVARAGSWWRLMTGPTDRLECRAFRCRGERRKSTIARSSARGCGR